MDTFVDIVKKYSSIDTTYGTDKNTSHSYGPVYETIFREFRTNKKNILEIGFDSGASLQVYSEYFYNSEIYGIDIIDHCLPYIKQNKHIHLLFGDAKNKNTVNYYNKQYNIIIEDASHLLEDQITHFKDYNEFVSLGGLYIIEDVHEQNLHLLKNELEPLSISKGFTLKIIDLRHIKHRFDDILFVFTKIKNLISS